MRILREMHGKVRKKYLPKSEKRGKNRNFTLSAIFLRKRRENKFFLLNKRIEG